MLFLPISVNKMHVTKGRGRRRQCRRARTVIIIGNVVNHGLQVQPNLPRSPVATTVRILGKSTGRLLYSILTD